MSRVLPPAALVAGLLASAVGWAQPPTFIASWTVTGPEDVAVDASGHVFVTHDAQHVLEFTSGGVLIRQWGSSGSGNGQFLAVQGLALDAAGDVYVVDTGNHRIQKFDNDGNYLGQWGVPGTGDGQFSTPTGVDVDNHGHVDVMDVSFASPPLSRIEKFTDTGTFLASWGSQGSGPGQFSGPYALAIAPDGRVYVGDSGNHRVVVFDAEGTFLFQWGSQGVGQGQFSTPSGIVLDGAGRVYVCDNAYNRIQVFSSEGQYLMQWGTGGHAAGQFLGPLGIAIDVAGNVYVSDYNNNRIQVFGSIPTPTYATSWGALKARYRP